MGKEKGMLHGILIKVDGGVLNGSQGVRESTWWVPLVGGSQVQKDPMVSSN